MGMFCRVEAVNAGAAALGILIPPSRRTFLILRPRALPFDLLLCRGTDDLTFFDLAHDEASAAAQAIFRELREGLGSVEVIAVEASCQRLLARVGPYTFVACPRVAGQPYIPLAVVPGEAATSVTALAAILCPMGEQEVYFNTRFFERSAD